MADDLFRKCLSELETNDVKRRTERARRLATFDRTFEGRSAGFFGGRSSFDAYRELRSAFAEGHYLTATILASSCVEMELGARLYARGVRDGDMSRQALVRIAFALNEIDTVLRERITELASTSEAYASFRPPVQDSQTLSVGLHNKLGSHKLSEHDANDALRVLADVLARPAFTPDP